MSTNPANPRAMAALAGAALVVMFYVPNEAAGRVLACNPIWSYPADTWRVHPNSLNVHGSSVTVQWHIDDVDLPDAPDYLTSLVGKLSIQVDEGAVLSEDVFQSAKSVTPREFRISNLKRGWHQLLVSINGTYFSSCFSTPGTVSIRRWYGPGDSIPIP